MLLVGCTELIFFKFQYVFGSVFEEKKSDSVRNVLGSVRLKNAVRFGYYSYLLLMSIVNLQHVLQGQWMT